MSDRLPRNLHPYARDVLRGKVVAGPLVRAACERSRRDHETAHERGLTFSRRAAEHVLAFVPHLRHSKGEWAGQPFALAPWQSFMLWELFGWLRADGTRRYRRAYAEVARKNGKTTLLGTIGLYLLAADGEQGAEIYTAATKRDQARIMHGEAVRMVRASAELGEVLETYRDNISCPMTQSKYEPLGADAKTLDGLNVHGALIDELHAHPDGSLYEVLDTATGARRSPLIFAITTAGDDETSFCFSQRTYCEQVVRGALVDDATFVFIACLDADDDWRDESVWIKANPNLGVSVKLDQLREQVREAERNPRKQNSVRRLLLNQWTRATTRFLDLAAWDRCAGDAMPAQIEEACAGRPAYGGLDLASTNDITAFGLVFPPAEEGEVFRTIWRFWIPEDGLLERMKQTRLPYDQWIADGWIRATEGNVTDYRVVRDDILELVSRYDLVSAGFDPWNSTATINDLREVLGDRLVGVAPNYPQLSPATKMLERLVLGGRIEHGGNPVARWMADNLEVKEHDGALRPVKPGTKMSHKKIDGMVALILALSRIEAGDVDNTQPVELRGPVIA